MMMHTFVCRSKAESNYYQEEHLRAKDVQDPSADISLALGKCMDFGDHVARYSGYVRT